MHDYGPSTYGDRIAGVYDAWFHPPSDPGAAVDFLAELAGSGPALELAIGTGRIALPLASRGVEIQGIDASAAMVTKLREKPGGMDIPVTMGDFADVPVEGRFRLVFVVFNTLFALLTQDDQRRCLRNVAKHLTDDGVFVVEAFVPDIARFDRGQRVDARRVELGRAFLEVSRHDAGNQRVSSQLVVLEETGFRMFPVELRYVWPSELDLMAELAGLRLRERWGGWTREPFTGEATHVSVYERASP
ncbi:MAG TPA: class I SAM-dependent methyltransferase [Actinomycetota bacterium]|nr:class I SAM-dependent methyltransferase [Actinomycetota bacterium]